jgi:hypothetical protein
MSIDLSKYLDYIEKSEIPPDFPHGLTSGGFSYFDNGKYDLMTGFNARKDCCAKGLWIVIDKKWTKKLAQYINGRKCLEIMAGGGWLTKALLEHGVDIVATDNFSWAKEKLPHKTMKPVIEIEKLDAIEAVNKYRDRDVLVVSWPHSSFDNVLCEACQLWGREKEIVYIGEGEEGCCAGMDFWHCFKALDIKIPMKSWDGLHDYVFVGHYDKELFMI